MNTAMRDDLCNFAGQDAPLPEDVLDSTIPAQSQEPRTKRGRRARRACLSCRARKVRCDVMRVSPCTNCKLDQLECKVKLRQRKCNKPAASTPCASHEKQVLIPFPNQVSEFDASILHNEEPEQQRFLSGETTETCASGNTSKQGPLQYDFMGFEEMMDFPDEPIRGGETGDFLDTNLDSYFLGITEAQSQSTQSAPRAARKDDWSRSLFSSSIFNKAVPKRDSLIKMISSQQDRPAETGMFVLYICYPFISADSLQRLGQDDVVHLEQRKCLHIPRRPALNEFIKQYFLYIHPFMPLLNEVDFWNMYNPNNPPSPATGTLSLFVIQTLLFIACPFVPLSTLHDLGFSSVHQARAVFYSKAKTLFYIDEGRDDISSAQGALMLTYHSTTLNDKINSYWLGTAIHFARSAGVDRYQTIDKGSSKRGTLKRLWWCCILRDRCMALGLRRPLHIQPSDFDFTQPGLLEEDIRDELRGSMVYSPATKQVLLRLTESLCELAVALNDVLAVCYPKKAEQYSVESRPLGDIETLRGHALRLDVWYQTALEKFQIPTRAFGIQEPLVLFTSAIYIYYHTAKAFLWNHITLLSHEDPEAESNGHDVKQRAFDAIQESLRSISSNFTELEQRGLTKFLPNTFVAFLVLPFSWRTSDIAIQHRDQNRNSVKDLEVYRHIFIGFRNLYEITDGILQCIENPNESIQELHPEG